MMDPQLQQLLQQHAQFLTVLDNGKVCCTLNNHHLPARYDVVNAFVSGGKYAKLVKRHQDSAQLKALEPLLVPSINYSDKLFCALTCQLLTATAEAASTHMQGKKFVRHRALYEAKQMELFVEPKLSEEEEDPATAGDGDHEGMEVGDEAQPGLSNKPQRKLVEVELMLPPPTPGLAGASKKRNPNKPSKGKRSRVA